MGELRGKLILAPHAKLKCPFYVGQEEGGKGEGGNDYAVGLTAQVQRLSQELRQLAASSRTVKVVHLGSGGVEQ